VGRSACGKAAKVLPSFQCRTSSSVAAFAEVVSTGGLLLVWAAVYLRGWGMVGGEPVFGWHLLLL
jgi:hypothetical protein